MELFRRYYKEFEKHPDVSFQDESFINLARFFMIDYFNLSDETRLRISLSFSYRAKKGGNKCMRKMILTSGIKPKTVLEYVKKRKINIEKIPWRSLVLDSLLENDGHNKHYLILPNPDCRMGE